MSPQLCFFVSIAFALLGWWIVAKRVFWPRLRLLPMTEALQPILVLHSFRFIGLAFLVPGVVSPELPATFANAAAYGDLAAAILALLTLAALPSRTGVVMAWIFNVWGTVDLFDAFYRANASGLTPGELGVMYFIPTLIVPLLLITHGLSFRILFKSSESSLPAGRREIDATPL